MPGSPYVIDYAGRFSLPAPPCRVWSAIGRVDQFEAWWGWLTGLTLEGTMLEPGAILDGIIAPPLPYRMRVRVQLAECEPLRRIEADVHGDLEGRATLLLEPEGEGTTASAAWTIEMMPRPMRLAARVAPALLRWGHDRVVEATVAGFRRHLRDGWEAAG